MRVNGIIGGMEKYNLIPDGYDVVGDDYVRKIPALSAKEIEKQIERNAPIFFDKIGYEIKKVRLAGNAKTVDYMTCVNPSLVGCLEKGISNHFVKILKK